MAVGWNYFIIWAAVLANEYNVISSIFVFWSDRVPIWGYFLIFWFAFMAFQLIGVEAFGEAEFWLALVKLLGLTAYFIFAIIYASGGLIGQDGALVSRYWNDPGPWNGNGFRGVAAVFVFCSTFYAGVECVAVAATETRNPGVAVPQAIRQVFWRIIFIYMRSAFFFGLTCPANADQLVEGGSRSLQSPMTVAIQIAGWQGGVHLVSITLPNRTPRADMGRSTLSSSSHDSVQSTAPSTSARGLCSTWHKAGKRHASLAGRTEEASLSLRLS